jgi:hypothetical protein
MVGNLRRVPCAGVRHRAVDSRGRGCRPAAADVRRDESAEQCVLFCPAAAVLRTAGGHARAHRVEDECGGLPGTAMTVQGVRRPAPERPDRSRPRPLDRPKGSQNARWGNPFSQPAW